MASGPAGPLGNLGSLAPPDLDDFDIDRSQLCAVFQATLAALSAGSQGGSPALAVGVGSNKSSLESEPVTERFRYRISAHVSGAFYPFAVHRDCPGASLVLAIRFPLSGESYRVCAPASNSPRSHALSSRVTSGTPCRRETISKYRQDSRLGAKLLRSTSQLLKLVPTILSTDSRALLLRCTTQSAGGSLSILLRSNARS
jgi:hypothetical protein